MFISRFTFRPVMTLTVFCVLFTLPSQVVRGEEQSTAYPGPLAMKRLQSLRGRNVELVLQQIDGTLTVQYARVKYADERRVEFDRHFTTLPGRQENLISRFFERRFQRPFPETAEDRALLAKSVGVRFLSLDGNALNDGPRRYQVLSLKPVEFEKPKIESAFVYRAVKLDPLTDPWQSTRGSGPSAWVIRYGPPDEPDQFEFRLPNPAHYPHQRIDTVVMHDRPGWRYDQVAEVNRAVVVFTARHIGQAPAQGYFELDAEGFPRGGRYRGNLYSMITKSTLAEIQKLRESALVSRRSFVTTARPADSVAGSGSTTPHRMLRYQFEAGRAYQVTAEKTSEISGSLSGRDVAIRKTVTEYLTVRVNSVGSDGTAVLDVVPDRYVVLLETTAGGRVIKSERLDTTKEQAPESAVLQHLAARFRPHLGKRMSLTASRRGLLKPRTDSAAAGEFRLFRAVQCGFQAPLLPLFPKDSFPVDGGWEDQSTLTGAGTVHSIWCADGDATHVKWGESAFRGQGDIRTVDGNGRSTIATTFTATLRLTADELLPASLELTAEDVPISGSIRLQDARHRTTESLSWERRPRTPGESR